MSTAKLTLADISHLPDEQQTEVLVAFYEAAGQIGAASQAPMGFPAAIAIAAGTIAAAVALWAMFRYG